MLLRKREEKKDALGLGLLNVVKKGKVWGLEPSGDRGKTCTGRGKVIESIPGTANVLS